MATGNKHRKPLLSARMKLADLPELDSRLLGVFTRMGLGFGFGEDSVEEACRKNGVDVTTFLLICYVYLYDGNVPSEEVLQGVEVRDIVRYLRNSHAYYMEVAMDNLEDLIERMLVPCEEKRKQVIRRFFIEYKQELARHFAYEENTVFPYVEAVLGHQAPGAFTILQYEENHSNVEEKLGDLKNLIMKYIPAECDPQATVMVLMHLYYLERDLRDHTSIEDNILVPVVNALEKDENR